MVRRPSLVGAVLRASAAVLAAVAVAMLPVASAAPALPALGADVSATATPTTFSWFRTAQTNLPTPTRSEPAIAYDAAHHRTVLFGGTSWAPHPESRSAGETSFADGNSLGDTWLFDGGTERWTQVHPATSPSPRTGAAMTFDAARGVVVLFGGFGPSGALRDTWTWNGTTWTQRHPATSPPGRGLGVFVGDPARGDAVLFGGDTGETPGTWLGDTWTWNGANWTLRPTATVPPARMFASATFDARAGRVVLFGGAGNYEPGVGAPALRDTWLWDGTRWTRAADGPADRVNAKLSFDPAVAGTLLYGGWRDPRVGDPDAFNDTWVWRGTRWERVATPTSPSRRGVASGFVYDSDHGSQVLLLRVPDDRYMHETWLLAPAEAEQGGYWLVASDGGVFTFGDATFHGSATPIQLDTPIVGIAVPRVRNGYLMVSAYGEVLICSEACGGGRDPRLPGSVGVTHPVVGISATPTGLGHWLVATDGGIFSFGDARFYGSTGGIRLRQPVVGMAPTPTGRGYWLVATDGGIFTFGDAKFYGSTGAVRLNKPIVGMAATPTGRGYWLVATDGGIFTFGDAEFYGSTGAIRLNQPVVGMAAAATWARTTHGDPAEASVRPSTTE